MRAEETIDRALFIHSKPMRSDMSGAEETIDRALSILNGNSDRDEGRERLMKKIVEVYNKLTGNNMTETEGYLFMTTLKLVRMVKNPSNLDNYIDAIGYIAMGSEKAEDDSSIEDDRCDICNKPLGETFYDINGFYYCSLNCIEEDAKFYEEEAEKLKNSKKHFSVVRDSHESLFCNTCGKQLSSVYIYSNSANYCNMWCVADMIDSLQKTAEDIRENKKIFENKKS